MALPTLYEIATSRDFSITSRGAEVVVRWISLGSRDETEVYEATLIVAPVIYDGLVRRDLQAKYLGGLAYYVDVTYGVLDQGSAPGVIPGAAGAAPADSKALGPSGVGATEGNCSWEVSAGTTHITQSRQTRYRWTAADTAPGAGVGTGANQQQAIGVSEDRVEGCDIVSPRFEFTIERSMEEVKLPYVRDLRDAVGTINDAAWWGFEAGEVLYLGATGRFSGDGATAPTRWTVTHKFAVGKNEQNVDIGGGITLPEVGAWDYVWVAFRAQIAGNKQLEVPEVGYVERVYRESDFATLQVGV